MTENRTVFYRNEEYNALTGRYQRKASANDIVQGTGRTAGAGADLSLATLSAAAGFTVYPYHFSLGAPAAATFAIVNGSSTIGYEYLSAAGNRQVTLARDRPFCKIAASTTLTVVAINATSGATYTANIVGIREPTDAYLVNQ